MAVQGRTLSGKGTRYVATLFGDVIRCDVYSGQVGGVETGPGRRQDRRSGKSHARFITRPLEQERLEGRGPGQTGLYPGSGRSEG